MTLLLWDQTGERRYETGVDRGVLYTPNQGAVPWNGLISITEKVSGNEKTALYFDGIKFADAMFAGDFSAVLKAYTYPDEFVVLEGLGDVGNGLFVGNQEPLRFGLSYRTKIGNDVEGEELGYKIHILYNLLATPSQKSYQTISGSNALEFEWELTAVPGVVHGFRPTAHVIFDTRYMNPLFIQDIEMTLYGDTLHTAKLPPISTLVSFSSDWVIIRIVDNGNGTWTATGPDNLITMLDSTTFQIIQANAIYLDINTYMISDLTH